MNELNIGFVSLVQNQLENVEAVLNLIKTCDAESLTVNVQQQSLIVLQFTLLTGVSLPILKTKLHEKSRRPSMADEIK